MKVGIVGLGKLGLPVAYTMASFGHEVCGTDINPAVQKYINGEEEVPFQEEGLPELMEKHSVKWQPTITEVVANSDIVFVAVQTPHEPEFEGSTRIPDERKDFDYRWLCNAVSNTAKAAKVWDKQITLVTISTCLPGTYEREIKPLLNSKVDYVYNPFFIAMGTVIHDFTHPEFVLIGTERDQKGWEELFALYDSMELGLPFLTDIATAEGIKVFYNTYITAKTVLANTYGEMAHKLGMNVDDIHKALSMSTDRLMSGKYLKAGMGDGGGCHPRDNIALSYLANKVDLSHNIFEDLMQAREDHAEWLADECLKHGKKILVLGRSFKPETNIETGSPAILVANILEEKGAELRHYEDWPWGGTSLKYNDYHFDAIFIGTEHQRYKDYAWPKNCPIIDPFGFLPEQKEADIIRIGR